MTKEAMNIGKQKLSFHRHGRPRWGIGYHQRIVPQAKTLPARKASTRELLAEG